MRSICKDTLHAKGLGMYQIGNVANLAFQGSDATAIKMMSAAACACSFPRARSPAGDAFYSLVYSIGSACNVPESDLMMDDPSPIRDWVVHTALQSRSFAARMMQ